jgi:hypothetical protein
MTTSPLPGLWASLFYLRCVATLVPVHDPWHNKLALSCAGISTHRRDEEEASSSLKLVSLDVNQDQVHEIL